MSAADQSAPAEDAREEKIEQLLQAYLTKKGYTKALDALKTETQLVRKIQK